MDLELAALRDAAAARGVPGLAGLTPRGLRERVTAGNALCRSGPDLPSVEDTAFPAGNGHRPARVYRGGPAAGERTLVYLHGGGWVTGDLGYADEFCRFLARDAGCTVVSVDYRLAPEHPFPEPLEDAYAGLLWAARTVAARGALAVAGDSAGGNLAAACALRARDAGGPRLAFQLLVYPVLDHDFSRGSYQAASFPLGREEMRWFWDRYLPDQAMRGRSDASPLRAGDLAGLPPAHLVLAGHDPLRDEGVEYAASLRRAGVPVTVEDHPALCHGFLRFTGACAAARAAVPGITGRAAGLFGA